MVVSGVCLDSRVDLAGEMDGSSGRPGEAGVQANTSGLILCRPQVWVGHRLAR